MQNQTAGPKVADSFRQRELGSVPAGSLNKGGLNSHALARESVQLINFGVAHSEKKGGVSPRILQDIAQKIHCAFGPGKGLQRKRTRVHTYD